MYENKGLFTFGRWINGGHWTTCEARMMLGYYRVGAYRDAAESFRQILKLAPVFRLDNNLTDFGSEPYQPKLPINCVYDSWGAPGGFLRGLFEYEYLADGMRIYPHVPDSITKLEQGFPVWFGEKKIYFQTNGNGPVNSVLVNGKEYRDFDAKSIQLKLDPGAGEVSVSIGLGGEKADPEYKISEQQALPMIDPYANITALLPDYKPKQGSLPTMELLLKLSGFASRLEKEGLGGSYEFSHTRLILESVSAIQERTRLKKEGKLVSLPDVSQTAADQLYLDTLTKLCLGLTTKLEKNLASDNKVEKQIAGIWKNLM
jgi:hypothetical protein